MRCNKHKRYKAKLRPRCDCVDCWQMFLEETATYNDVCKEIDRRTPKDSPTISYVIDMGPNPIMEMLIDCKKKFEGEK